MSTTPPVITTQTPVHPVVNSWVAFVKGHEKLLIATIIALLLFHFGNKAYDAYTNHLNATASADKVQIAEINKTLAQTQADLATAKANLLVRTKKADATITKSKQTLVVKEAEVAALPLPELSKEWETLIALPSSITPQTNGTIVVTTDAAHTTVAELEKVGPLTEQLIATQDKYDACTTVTVQQDKNIADLNDKVAAEQKSHTDDVKAVNAKARKSFLRGFKYGLVTGVVATTVAVIAILH